MTATLNPGQDMAMLTPADTYTMFLDALPMTQHWAHTRTERLVGEAVSDTDPVTDWAEWIVEDEPGATPVLLTHDSMQAAIYRVAVHSEGVALNSEIVGQVRAVFDAFTNDDATDEMCQLDCIGFDALVQVAVLGDVVYG